MDNTINISLHAMPFTLTQEAYIVLKNYLERLNSFLGQSPEAKDVMESVETRMAEILSEHTPQGTVVSKVTVEKGIEMIGQPEQIDAERAEELREERAEQPNPRTRLYRDLQHRTIGGVCAGIGAKLRVDAWILRVIMIALCFFYGFGLLLYVVLWMAIPAAITPMQRLEMQGRPLSYQEMQREIKHVYDLHKRSLKDSRWRQMSGSKNFFIRLAYTLGMVLLAILRVLVGIVGVVLILVSSIAAVTTTIAFIIMGSSTQDAHLINSDAAWVQEAFGHGNEFIASLSWPAGFWIATWLLVIMLLAVLFLVGLRCLMRFRMHRRSIVTLILIWIAALCYIIAAGITGGLRLSHSSEGLYQRTPMSIVAGDTVRLVMYEDLQFDSTVLNSKKVRFGQDRHDEWCTEPSIRIWIRPVDSLDEPRLSIKPTGAFIPYRGHSRYVLKDIFPVAMRGHEVAIPTAARDAKIKQLGEEQYLTVSLYIPEGAYLEISPNLAGIMGKTTATGWRTGEELCGKLWRMEQRHLVECGAQPIEKTK